MQLGFQLYGGSLGLWRFRRTARRPLVVKPRGMACRCVARQNRQATPLVATPEIRNKSKDVRTIIPPAAPIKQATSQAQPKQTDKPKGLSPPTRGPITEGTGT